MLGAACGRGASRGRADARVRYPVPIDPFPLEFARKTDSLGQALSHLVSDSLVWFDHDLDIVPRVAYPEWSEDRMTLMFRLRPGVLWHDGRPVTAGDVVHTYRATTDPATAPPDRAYYFNRVEDVAALDPLTVRVRYRTPCATALLGWSTAPLVPSHVPFRAERPLGCGAFTVEDWVKGERIVLRRFPRYHDGPAGIEHLQFDVLPDSSTMVKALLAGQIDVAPLVADRWRELRDEASFNARFSILEYRVLAFNYVAWRIGAPHGLFDDPRVRLAMTLAIDRPRYLEQVVPGAGDLAATSFHPGLWGHDPSLVPWPFDPQRARGLLAAAGFRAGEDGVLARGGTPFRFNLLFATNADAQRLAEFIEACLRALGVAVQLEQVPFAVTQERLRERRYDAVLSTRRLDADPDPFELWHSSQADSGANYACLRDAAIDAAIEEARATLDRSRRETLYRQIAARLHELQPYTFNYYPVSRLAVSRAIRGVTTSSLGVLSFWPGVHGWTVE